MEIKLTKTNIESLYKNLSGIEYSDTFSTKLYSFNDLNETISSSKTEILEGNVLDIVTEKKPEEIKP